MDEIVRLVKAGAVPLPVPPLSQIGEPQDECRTDADLPADLARALKLLETLGGVLASDPEVVTRHGTALQNLDIAMQVIAAVEAILVGDSNLEIDATKLPGLRRSADQALQQGS